MTHIELIDQYLDSLLTSEQAQQLEVNLQNDAELQRLFYSVKIAREAIQSRALSARVKKLHGQYIHEIERHNDNVIPASRWQSSSSGWILRIAASFLLLLMAYSTYQFSQLTTDGFYNDKYLTYRLPVTRGNTVATHALDVFYASGDMKAVIRQFASQPTKEPRDYFLTAMAHLQQNEYSQAATLLSQLRQYNVIHNTSYFGQESDYYLALAYIGSNRLSEAQHLFEAIHNSPQHLYSRTVTEADLLTLKALSLKSYR
jgi:hypothetical protein